MALLRPFVLAALCGICLLAHTGLAPALERTGGGLGPGQGASWHRLRGPRGIESSFKERHPAPRTPRRAPPHRAHSPARAGEPASQGASTGAGGCPDVELRPDREDLERIRAAVLCLVNRERTDHGEATLTANAHLEHSAQGHTESMAFGDYFGHDSPGGETPSERMRAAGYIDSSKVGYEVGENIGWGTLEESTPAAILAAWMASPGHRANILDSHFRDTGVGVSPHPPSSLANGQPGGIYTQDFGVIITG